MDFKKIISGNNIFKSLKNKSSLSSDKTKSSNDSTASKNRFLKDSTTKGNSLFIKDTEKSAFDKFNLSNKKTNEKGYKSIFDEDLENTKQNCIFGGLIDEADYEDNDYLYTDSFHKSEDKDKSENKTADEDTHISNKKDESEELVHKEKAENKNAIESKLFDKDGNPIENSEVDKTGNIKITNESEIAKDNEINTGNTENRINAEETDNIKPEKSELCSSGSVNEKSESGEDEETDEISAADKEKDIQLLEKLNEKYDLNIDFNEELTEDQLKLLQQAYLIDVQKNSLDATEKSMLDYFDTLGLADNIYDAIKGLFGSGVTKQDVEEYYELERKKNDLLISIVKNGGSVTFDESLKALIAGLIDDDGAAALAEVKDNLSFEEAYKILKGVEYNPELISQVMESQESYTLVSTEYQNAVAIENMMANSSPKDILEYFNKLAEGQEGVTGEDLFNQYYKTFFEKYPDKFNTQDSNGLTCKGISVKDGYLWQEVAFPEGLDDASIEMLAQSEFLYKEVDENGNVKYYKVVNLEDEHKVKSNINGQDEEFQVGGFANKADDPTYANNPLALFYKANDSIKENNLYLEKTKEDYDEVYGKGAFDTILEEYPKMYEQAFGKNELLDKLTEYSKDMDSYSRTLSQALSIGCFVASFIPGVNIASWVPLAIAGSDNIIDLINLTTNKKDGEIGKWAADTLLEAGMIAIGMGINKFASKMGYKFTANQINKGNEFVMAHAQGVKAAVEYTVDNIASVLWDIGRGIVDGSLINEDGSFNWDYFQKMFVSDMIFNTADLRNGMSLYKSLSDNSVNIADGVKFTMDPDTSEVKFTYDDGYEISIGKDGKGVLTNPETGESVDLTYNKSTKSWETPDGTKVDLTESNPALAKLKGDSNTDDIDNDSDSDSDSDINSDSDTDSDGDTIDKIHKNSKYEGETKEAVDDLLKDETVNKLVSDGFLSEDDVFKIAEGGADAVNKAVKLLNSEQIQKYIDNEIIMGGSISRLVNDPNYDKLVNLLELEKVDKLITDGKLGFLDIIEFSDYGPEALNNLTKMLNGENVVFTARFIKMIEDNDNAFDSYITQLATNKKLIDLCENDPSEYRFMLEMFSHYSVEEMILNPKFCIDIDEMIKAISDPDMLHKITNLSLEEIEEIAKLKDLDKSLCSLDKEYYDIANFLFHGMRVDESLEGVTVNGVSIKFDNNMVTEAYLKAHPEFEIDPDNTIVVTQEMMDNINAAIKELADAGIKVPDKIYITDLFGPDSQLNGGTAIGYFTPENPDSLYIRNDKIADLDRMRETIAHEAAHMSDYMGFDGKTYKYNSDDSIYKIDKDFAADGLDASDISTLISNYSLKNNQEFVAEVTELIANGTIVYKNGKYVINGKEYINAKGQKVKVTKDVNKKINKIMEIYNEMTKGQVAKAKEIK